MGSGFTVAFIAGFYQRFVSPFRIILVVAVSLSKYWRGPRDCEGVQQTPPTFSQGWSDRILGLYRIFVWFCREGLVPYH